MASPHSPRLAILVADTPLPDIVDRLGAYPAIFKSWLVSSAFVETNVVLQEYDAREGKLPSDPTQFDGMIITGSKHSAYEDTPWIKDLIAYVARVASDFPQVRLIGICFGHQIIAQALGGPTSTRPNTAGWETGVYSVNLTRLGTRVFGGNTIDIHQMHRDHVPEVPPGCSSLGSTQKCPVQGFVKLYRDLPPDAEVNLAKDVQIFAVQGHPEFTGYIVETIVKARGATGAMDAATVKDGLERANKPHQGNTTIGQTVWKILGLK